MKKTILSQGDGRLMTLGLIAYGAEGDLMVDLDRLEKLCNQEFRDNKNWDLTEILRFLPELIQEVRSLLSQLETAEELAFNSLKERNALRAKLEIAERALKKMGKWMEQNNPDVGGCQRWQTEYNTGGAEAYKLLEKALSQIREGKEEKDAAD